MQNSAVEIQFRLHATGRPRVKTGPSNVPPSGNGRLPRVTQVMALAIQFQDMIQRGEARDYADLARLGGLTRERISQVMKLIWLAPDIQRDILEFSATTTSRFPITEVAVRRIAESFGWAKQREQWLDLRHKHHLL